MFGTANTTYPLLLAIYAALRQKRTLQNQSICHPNIIVRQEGRRISLSKPFAELMDPVLKNLSSLSSSMQAQNFQMWSSSFRTGLCAWSFSAYPAVVLGCHSREGGFIARTCVRKRGKVYPTRPQEWKNRNIRSEGWMRSQPHLCHVRVHWYLIWPEGILWNACVRKSVPIFPPIHPTNILLLFPPRYVTKHLGGNFRILFADFPVILGY